VHRQSNVRAILTDHHLRCTRQRVEVFSALASTKSHPTAEQLHRMLQVSSPGISLGTVYNTLEALCAAGLTRKLPTLDGPARYDADTSNHLHAFTQSGEVLDLPADLSAEVLAAIPADLRQRLQQRLGTSVDHVHIDLTNLRLAAQAAGAETPGPNATAN
jgi:Fur family peroxide stress response transcriptional regulator